MYFLEQNCSVDQLGGRGEERRGGFSVLFAPPRMLRLPSRPLFLGQSFPSLKPLSLLHVSVFSRFTGTVRTYSFRSNPRTFDLRSSRLAMITSVPIHKSFVFVPVRNFAVEKSDKTELPTIDGRGRLIVDKEEAKLPPWDWKGSLREQTDTVIIIALLAIILVLCIRIIRTKGGLRTSFSSSLTSSRSLRRCVCVCV
jgi:hypothetical protein